MASRLKGGGRLKAWPHTELVQRGPLAGLFLRAIQDQYERSERSDDERKHCDGIHVRERCRVLLD